VFGPIENDAADIERSIETFASVPNSGLILLPDSTLIVHRDRIVALAARHLGREDNERGMSDRGLGPPRAVSHMWRAVITRAISDATMILRTEKRGENARAQTAARDWLPPGLRHGAAGAAGDARTGAAVS
jgi:hypothetical protein